MNGRIANETKIERGTEARLKEMPDYVSMWYLNLKASKKTAATCRDYICKIHNFLSFIGGTDVKSVPAKEITEERPVAVLQSFIAASVASVPDGEQN